MRARRPEPVKRRSQAVRLGAWLAALVGAVVLLYLALLLRVLQAPMHDAVAGLAAQLTMLKRALATVPVAERPALARALSRPGALVRPEAVADRPPLPPDGAPDGPPQGFLDELQQRTGEPVHWRYTPPGGPDGGGLALGLVLDDQVWWLPTHDTFTPLDGLWQGAVLVVLFLGLAGGSAGWMGMVLLTRPMRRLADALVARRAAPRPLSLEPGASTEEAQIAEAFNALLAAQAQRRERRRETLAGLSHDLRTPLARLRLRAETELPEAQAAKVEADIAALQRIVTQFVAYMDSEEARQAPGRPERLRELVTRTCLSDADLRGLQWTIDGSDWSAVRAPDLAVQRLLGNLLDNAYAHGQGQVSVSLTQQGGRWWLWVADEGRGIHPAELGAALQPFVKLPGGKGREAGHCGLGLAIVADLVQALQGELVHRPFDGSGWALGVSVPLDGTSTRV